MNHTEELLRDIRTRLSVEKVVKLPSSVPAKLQQNLSRSARRRGYRWTISKDSGNVYISLRKAV